MLFFQPDNLRNNKFVHQKGVSLVELVLVTAAVVVLALLIGNLPSSVASINKSRHLSIAREVASKQIESLRKQTYQNLSNGTISFTDAKLSSLSQAAASYEINDCPISLCALSEEAKQVKVRVSWNELGDNKEVELTTIISQGGIGQ